MYWKLIFKAIKYLPALWPIISGWLKKKRKKGDVIMSDENKYGIEDTLEALDFIVPFAQAIDVTTKDGFQIIDAVKFVPSLTKLPAAIIGGKNIPREMNDLNDMEREQVRAKVIELDFEDEYAEAIGEKGLAAVFALGELLAALKKDMAA